MLTYSGRAGRGGASRARAEEFVVRVYGQDLDVLQAKGNEITQALAGIDGVVDPRVQLPPQEPTIEIEDGSRAGAAVRHQAGRRPPGGGDAASRAPGRATCSRSRRSSTSVVKGTPGDQRQRDGRLRPADRHARRRPGPARRRRRCPRQPEPERHQPAGHLALRGRRGGRRRPQPRRRHERRRAGAPGDRHFAARSTTPRCSRPEEETPTGRAGRARGRSARSDPPAPAGGVRQLGARRGGVRAPAAGAGRRRARRARCGVAISGSAR